MDVFADAPGVGDLKRRLGRFDKDLRRELGKAWKSGSKDLAKRQKAALSGQQKLVRQGIKVFQRGDAAGVSFKPLAAHPAGMGIFAGAKRYERFPPYIGVDPDSGGHVFYPEARMYGDEVAKMTVEALEEFAGKVAAR